jgi:choline-glycine betaine transporter
MMISQYADRSGGLPHASNSADLRLQILTAEHWSLASTRSLTYSESLSRVTMFLSVLSGSVVALALLVQVDHLRETFLAAAIPVLSVVLFVGVSTIVRLSELNREDLRSVLTRTS